MKPSKLKLVPVQLTPSPKTKPVQVCEIVLFAAVIALIGSGPSRTH